MEIIFTKLVLPNTEKLNELLLKKHSENLFFLNNEGYALYITATKKERQHCTGAFTRTARGPCR